MKGDLAEVWARRVFEVDLMGLAMDAMDCPIGQSNLAPFDHPGHNDPDRLVLDLAGPKAFYPVPHGPDPSDLAKSELFDLVRHVLIPSDPAPSGLVPCDPEPSGSVPSDLVPSDLAPSDHSPSGLAPSDPDRSVFDPFDPDPSGLAPSSPELAPDLDPVDPAPDSAPSLVP